MWLKALVDAEGDAAKQKVAYTKARIAILLAEQRERRQEEEAERQRAEQVAHAATAQAEAQQEFEKAFEQQDYATNTPWGMERLVDLAIRARVDLSARDLTGKTLLHLAAQCGAAKAVNRLLQAGADPNAPDGSGYGPLYYAEAMSQRAVAAALRKVGAKVVPLAKEPMGSQT
jgi:hypothetical protein